MQKLLSLVRRAIDDYSLIEEGDTIAVGLSGGKDSMTLLMVLAELRRFYPKNFTLKAITVDMGFKGVDLSPMQKLCDEINVPYIIKKSDLAEILFEIRKEKNPCSLCAKMRRGILNDVAKSEGCNKIALGHHSDDVVETFFLSLFYEGRLYCFSPKLYLDRTDITHIRPMIYVSENYIKKFRTQNSLPVVENPCPANGNTKREDIKNYIKTLEKDHRKIKQRVFGALQRSEIEGWHCENTFTLL